MHSQATLKTNKVVPTPTGGGLLFGTAPALGDINGDGTLDVAVSRDDTVYAFNIKDNALLFAQRVTEKNSDRLYPDQQIPSAVLTDLSGDGKADIIVNGLSDGMIHAFRGGDSCDGNEIPGFPVVMRGVSSASPTIADLDADGKLDLVCADEDLKLYAWNLNIPDTVYQPWPSSGGNAWNTRSADLGRTFDPGYVHLDFTWPLKKPAEMKLARGETTTFSITQGSWGDASSGVFTDFPRESWYHGDGCYSWNNYTYTGKFRSSAGSASSSTGLQFYHGTNEYAPMYFIGGGHGASSYFLSSTFTAKFIGVTQDTAVDTVANFQPAAGVWYNFAVKLTELANGTRIDAKFWAEGSAEPETYSIRALDTSSVRPKKGSIGMSYRRSTTPDTLLWDNIRVVGNSTRSELSNIAWQDFVYPADISPFHPVDWKDDFSRSFLSPVSPASKPDTSGFAATFNDLGFKPNVEISGPVTTRYLPERSGSFENYRIRGTMSKFASYPKHDSIGMGVIFYAKNAGEYYILRAKGKGVGGPNTFQLTSIGGQAHFGTSDTTLDLTFDEDGQSYGQGHTIEIAYEIAVSTIRDVSTGLPDYVHIEAKVAKKNRFQDDDTLIVSDSISVDDGVGAGLPAHSSGAFGAWVDTQALGTLADTKRVWWHDFNVLRN